MAHRLDARFAAFFAAAAGNANGEARAVTLRASEREVVRLAPPPAQPDEAYDEARDDSILLVGRYLWRTEAETLSSKSNIAAIGGGRGFRDSAGIRRIVREQMGEHYKGTASFATAPVARA